jgi:hypothetical protein
MPAPIHHVVLVGARLLDGRSPEAIADGVVVTDEQGRIVAAGPAQATTVPKDAERIDVTGLTVCPASSIATSTWRCASSRSTTRSNARRRTSSCAASRPGASSSRRCHDRP